MKRNQGFTSVIPLLVLGLGLVVAVLLVGRQTFFKPRASEPIVKSSVWGNMANFSSSGTIEMLSPTQILGARSMTFETWYKTPDVWGSGSEYVVEVAENKGLGAFLKVYFDYSQSSLVFNLNDSYSTSYATVIKSLSELKNGKWYHLAVSYFGGSTNGVFNAFVDGNLAGSSRFTISNIQYPGMHFRYVVLGRNLSGSLEETRIRQSNWYSSNFTPPSTPFVADSNTILLYRYNELGGSQTADSSGKGRHGSIVGNVQFSQSSIFAEDPNRPPVAKMIVGAPADMREPVKIKFMNASTDADGDAMTFLWNFGDGLISREASPTATFEVAQRPKPEKQTYNIKLTAFDSHGASSSATTSITVLANHNPKADFTIDQSNPDKVTVKFTNKSTDQDKDQLKYGWSFGDGTASTEISPIHSYPQLAEMKNYVVTLTADDNRGGVATKSATVKIANVTHKACSGLTCTSVKGPGADQCKTNTDCRNQ